MPRPKKESKNLNIRLDASTHMRLEDFCEETGMTKTVAVEKILDRYFETYFLRPKEDRVFH